MCTVLLVDDDACIRRLCFDILAGTRLHYILQADSGGQALEIASGFDGVIELLLSDISMPGGISGVDLAARLTVSRPETRVLLMSGLCPKQFTLQSGWHFLPKPFRPSDLLETVESALAWVPA